VDPDITGEVLVARQEARVVLAPGFHLLRDGREVPIVEDLGPRADRDPARRHREAHRP
jgi:hypothetical protein